MQVTGDKVTVMIEMQLTGDMVIVMQLTGDMVIVVQLTCLKYVFTRAFSHSCNTDKYI